MNRRKLLAIPVGVALVASIVAASAQSATAGPRDHGKAPMAVPATGPQAPSSKAPDLSAMAGLTGYQIVTSASLSDPANSQVHGTVSCASGMKVVGGGAIISSSQLTENLNSSTPSSDGSGWNVYVNNASSTAGTFTVYAVCVKKVSKYSVVVGTGVTNGAGTQARASVSCPTKTVPLGGGGFASSSSTLVNLNSTFPTPTGWSTDVNNASTGSNTATAFVVCGKQSKGYAQVAGTAVTINPGSQAGAGVSCPSGTRPLGGGSFSSTGATNVNVNSEFPTSTGWFAYQNNSASSSNSVTAYTVCARAA